MDRHDTSRTGRGTPFENTPGSAPGAPPITPAISAPDEHEYLSLGGAAKLAPGRPSTNAVWRWARKGIRSRSGERIRLKHVRAGGKVLTTAAWVREFCAALAAADEAYFNQKDEAAANLPARDPRFAPPSRRRTVSRRADNANRDDAADRINKELDEEGL